jgi:radical SAM superfamily enzyme YgiQ (UPF0313 family)
MLLGLPAESMINRLRPETEICYIYCRTLAEFIAVERISKIIKEKYPTTKVVLFENIHAVTSFSLEHVAGDFLSENVDLIVLGDPEVRSPQVTRCLLTGDDLSHIEGLVYNKPNGELVLTGAASPERDLDALAFPAWDLFELEGYWTVGFAHAPVRRNSRFVPLLTSRGCPYKCKFCLAPFVNSHWRARSAKNVVDEIEYFYKTLGITDFHVSDLNPTVDDRRTQDICYEIISRQLPITFKLAQGTKIETIKSEKTLELLAQAGCTFIAFSPETGSPRLLKNVGKPFDYDHALRMAKKMAQLGIRIQSCFIAGLPTETEEDRRLTLNYIKKLIAVGVDEISCYIFTPVPGSDLAHALEGYSHYSQCTPSPNWRKDYADILKFRYRVYGTFFLYKLAKPKKVLRELWGGLTRNFETKMEMSIYKIVKLYLLRYVPWIYKTTDVNRYA